MASSALLLFLVLCISCIVSNGIELEIFPRGSIRIQTNQLHMTLIQNIEDNLKEYKEITYHENVKSCDYESSTTSDEDVCYVSIDNWGPCSSENHYGYYNGTPCVFVKLEKIADWIPEPYRLESELPKDLPSYIKSNFRRISRFNSKALNTVWLSCEGDETLDKENAGPVLYFPNIGFPGYYFPFKNQAGYNSPIIAVYFEKPKRDVSINVTCRTWAKNIASEEAFVKFTLSIE